MMLIIMMVTMIISLLFLTWYIISFKEKESQTMNSSFESGFESSQTSFIPFSSQYFMVALIFLIFDLEIVLTLPAPISSNSTKSATLIGLFIILLTIMLIKEMKVSTLEWVK